MKLQTGSLRVAIAWPTCQKIKSTAALSQQTLNSIMFEISSRSIVLSVHVAHQLPNGPLQSSCVKFKGGQQILPQDAVDKTTAITPGIEQGSCPYSFAAGSAPVCARNSVIYESQIDHIPFNEPIKIFCRKHIHNPQVGHISIVYLLM